MSPEQMQLSKSWLAYYEQRTIASLFSKSWEAREAALSQIAKAIREFPESADGMQILEITVAMFKQVVLDAVYKVRSIFFPFFLLLFFNKKHNLCLGLQQLSRRLPRPLFRVYPDAAQHVDIAQTDPKCVAAPDRRSYDALQ